jgi:hypothetical protein
MAAQFRHLLDGELDSRLNAPVGSFSSLSLTLMKPTGAATTNSPRRAFS